MTFNIDGESTDVGIFTIILGNITIDDDIHEIKQSFALVAQLGDDVPDNFTCFQRHVGDTDCFGRTGATKIRIIDNNGE